MENLDKALEQFNKIAAKEKLFMGDITWGKVDKTPRNFVPGEVVRYNGLEVITTGDGAFSTYLKPGQIGVVVNNLAYGQVVLVSWEIGGGYMMTAPIHKKYLTKAPKRIERKKLNQDRKTDDMLKTIVDDPKLKPITTTPAMKYASKEKMESNTLKAFKILRGNKMATNFLASVILEQRDKNGNID